jgi:8-hydroxy-5-deazaflavin:NADPH oxidoreductase
MRMAIIGAGNVGKALGTGWAAKGHEIVFGVRDPAAADDAVLPARTRSASVAEAAKDAEIVVLATPWPATEEAIRAAGDLAGRIVIDCTNPLQMGADGLELALGHTTSGGEQVARWAKGAAVFKTFNQTGFENMTRGASFTALAPAMHVAGDDERRKPTVLALVRELGFEAIDAGGLKAARLLEPLAMLWIHMALNRNAGTAFAFAITRR